MFFTKHHRKSPPPYLILNHQLTWSPTTHYLGFHLNSTLTWHHHFTISVSKSQTLFKVLQPILLSSCPLPLDTCIKLWQPYILPILITTDMVVSSGLTFIHPHLDHLPSHTTPSSRFIASIRRHPNPRISFRADYDRHEHCPHRCLLDLHDYIPPNHNSHINLPGIRARVAAPYLEVSYRAEGL
ncbi:hypothetical protein PR048_025287 [Dryococelus australis]|uniref:Uncharacterized protein n=1 Tax=Dryococelus australis TaxID=614101 RepID=A0ABQ9GR03_9NEOP|nr:hypothetical protein PR048_025287 [Dryococelus australis]